MAQINPMPMGPWKITVYDQEYFQGRRMEFTACCQNIMECGMENIRSLKVECGAGWASSTPASAAQAVRPGEGRLPRSRPTVAATSYRIERMISFRPICCANHKESRMDHLREGEHECGRQFELAMTTPLCRPWDG
ncbi:hypothetical protein KUCAC02_003076 [Chaenocephalus aceratus]|uniref:Uncharacterized protein n=1 Tax=Chaenocephalus aceratus TaxID=36190 RepID=A0ACB9WKH4_CHAAC|nr:hypothetical protein KUCAC02_003076 [Chaenocephalus aceratus]